MSELCPSPGSSPVQRGRRRHRRVIESDSSDDDDDEKDKAIPPCDVLRQLAIATARVVKPATAKAHSPADTHKVISASLASVPVPGGGNVVVASFHGNALRMHPLSPATPDTIEASLEVGDCWNNDERESLVRLVRVLAINYSRTRIVLDVSYRLVALVHGPRAVRPRIDVQEVLRTAFGQDAVNTDHNGRVVVDLLRALPGELEKQVALKNAELVRASSGVSADDARNLDKSMLKSLRIFRVYTDKMARFLVDPDPGYGVNYSLDNLVTLELNARNDFYTIEADGSFKPCSFFLVGINSADGAVVCVRATLDINGQPLIGQGVDPVTDDNGGVIAYRSAVVGTHGAMYSFDPVWPVAANLIARSLRYSVEIGAFYGNPNIKGDSTRRLVSVLIGLAADAVEERHRRAFAAGVRATLRRETMMAFVYANGEGVPTVVPESLDPAIPADQRKYVVSPTPPPKGGVDPGQLGLRRLYVSLGLEPIAVADDKGLRAHEVPLEIQDVYSTRYLTIEEQFNRPRFARAATSLHVGSVDHVLQALGVRYGLEPVDIDAFKPLVKTLSELAGDGVYSIGRAVSHNPFMVIQTAGQPSMAYAHGTKDAAGNYLFTPSAAYEPMKTHRATLNKVRFINIDRLNPNMAMAPLGGPVIVI
jgi:hypothetical protein